MADLTQLVIIWACVYMAGIAANRTKLTPVLFFLFFGSLMVNLGVIPLQSSPFIRTFGELGIIVVMFALGFEENSQQFVEGIKRAWGIAFFGALAPFITAYTIADFFWNDSNLSIMFALTMTATAVSLTMVSLKSEGLQSTAAARGIMTSAVLDDIASLVMVAILVPLASGQADISIMAVFVIIVKVLIFFAIVSFVGIWLFPHADTGWFAKVPWLGRFSFSGVLGFGEGEQTTLTLLFLAVMTGIVAHQFGFHPAVGAYMAGLVLREEYFHLETGTAQSHYEATKNIIDNMAFSWLGPIFFVGLGAKLVIDWDILLAVLPHTLILVFGILISQVVSAGLAARYTAGFDFKDSLLIGFGMLGRAELAFVVIDIAYTQHNILTTEAFYTLMIGAFWLNLAVPVSIALWKRRYGTPM
ncbi:MAG: cation:proton antiporter [Halieaceae bacterium]|jgi:Kef-type K+ transport system membrane component KefB|nr:cation:proton antiporter [Halieaceae bacterium]